MSDLMFLKVKDNNLFGVEYYVDPELTDNDETYFKIIKIKDRNLHIPEKCKNRYDFDNLVNLAGYIYFLKQKYS
tara:strand:+ start:1047 stop:1268 length:222 start_codon:yes stop_codon:yes gene_type:complete